MSRPCAWLVGLAAGIGGVAAVAPAQLNPVSASGWNRDVVVESIALAPFAGSAMAFDVGNNLAWYQSGLPSSTKGLPASGEFNSASNAAIRFQLRPYNSPNVLFLDASTPTGTLTFDAPSQIRYDELAIAANSAGGGGTGTMVITFTDASTSGPISFNAQDWFFVTGNNALNNLGRISLTTDIVDDASAGNPRMYQTVVNLATLGLSNRSIASIAFTKPAAGAATAVWAISGRRAVTALTPVAASGYNRDIVVESTAAAPYSGAAMSFDVFNNLSWYERGLPASTKGLPQGGSFSSLANAAIQGQFQPYTGPNALFLDASSPTGTLSFDSVARRPYEFLAVFASSSNQGGVGTMVVNFTDGTSSPALNFNAQDWFNVTTNNALNNLGRANLNANTVDDSSASNPRIYQTLVDLTALGLNTRAVANITFTKPAVGDANQNTVIMAISGQPVPGVTGACISPDGTCAVLPQANCTGAYQGDNTMCPPSGACIAANGDCSIRTQANCTFVGGTFQGDNSTCPAPGACIAASGACTQLNSFQCAFQMGNFLGAASPCPVPGGCCINGVCTLVNSFQCAAQGGQFQGVGTVCDITYPAIVTSTAAFEDISGTGTELAWTGTNDDGNAVVNIGFTFPYFSNTYTSVFVVTNGFLVFGTASTDFSNDCPAPNTAAPNNAIFPYWDDFHIGTATFAHPGRVYAETRTAPNRLIVQWNRVGQYNVGNVPTDENTFQAVLFENGNIEFRYGAITVQTACDPTVGIENATGTVGLNYDNTLLGTGSVSLAIAAQQPCPTGPAEGACCAGTTCSVTTAAACTGANTRYAGDSTVCNVAGNNLTPCCRADYNQSGAVTVQDIFDFLSGYFTQNPAADINQSGAVTVQDIFDFLGAYFTGCA